MKKKIRTNRIISSLLAVLLIAFAVACGSGNEGIDESAAVRQNGVGDGEIYIDDEAIALAGTTTSSEDVTAAVANAFELINEERANAGLTALVWSDGLAQAASVRAQEIVTTFSHTRPNGSDWWTVNSSIQYGENLAKLYTTSESVVTAWMNSPTHKANIMDASFVTVGMAIYQTADGSWYWAQEFGY